jgi:hypothetical protein
MSVAAQDAQTNSVSLEAGDNVTVDFDNVGFRAWEVNGVSGDANNIEEVVVEDIENPTMTLVKGVEYTFEDLPGSVHPLEFFDEGDTALLSQDTEGTFEDDGSVGWIDTGDSVTFTVTDELTNEVDGYVCTIHASMEGDIQTTSGSSVSASLTFDEQATGSSTFSAGSTSDPGVVIEDVEANVNSSVLVTYEEGGDLIVAGSENSTADELDGIDLSVALGDTGGIPGESTAYIIPTDDLSQEYEAGDVVSEETAGASVANGTTTVYQGNVEIPDQSFDGEITEGTEVIEVATANLSDGEGGDTEFVIDVHPKDDGGSLLGGEFLAASNVLSGKNTEVLEETERFPNDGEFNKFPINGSKEVVAMMHLVDDGSGPGEDASPGEYPLLRHASSEGFITGGVTDDATIDAGGGGGDNNPNLDKYRNQNGNVDTGGLQQAINDFIQDDDVTTGDLQAVINAFIAS